MLVISQVDSMLAGAGPQLDATVRHQGDDVAIDREPTASQHASRKFSRNGVQVCVSGHYLVNQRKVSILIRITSSQGDIKPYRSLKGVAECPVYSWLLADVADAVEQVKQEVKGRLEQSGARKRCIAATAGGHHAKRHDSGLTSQEPAAAAAAAVPAVRRAEPAAAVPAVRRAEPAAAAEEGEDAGAADAVKADTSYHGAADALAELVAAQGVQAAYRLLMRFMTDRRDAHPADLQRHVDVVVARLQMLRNGVAREVIAIPDSDDEHPDAGAAQTRARAGPVCHVPDKDSEDDVQCAICLDTGAAFSLQACGHCFHPGCLLGYLNGKSAAYCHETNQFLCPTCRTQPAAAAAGGGVVQHEDLDRLRGRLPEAEQQGQLSSVLQFQAQAVTGSRSCVACPQVFAFAPGPEGFADRTKVSCPTCHTAQCGSCRVLWDDPVDNICHQGITCAQRSARYLAMRRLEQQQKERAEAAGLDPEALDEETQEMVAYQVACPGCGHNLSKIEWCNKMTCPGCNALVCYLCGQQLDKHTPYLHYQQPADGPCVGHQDTDKKAWLQLQEQRRGAQ